MQFVHLLPFPHNESLQVREQIACISQNWKPTFPRLEETFAPCSAKLSYRGCRDPCPADTLPFVLSYLVFNSSSPVHSSSYTFSNSPSETIFILSSNQLLQSHQFFKRRIKCQPPPLSTLFHINNPTSTAVSEKTNDARGHRLCLLLAFSILSRPIYHSLDMQGKVQIHLFEEEFDFHLST